MIKQNPQRMKMPTWNVLIRLLSRTSEILMLLDNYGLYGREADFTISFSVGIFCNGGALLLNVRTYA